MRNGDLTMDFAEELQNIASIYNLKLEHSGQGFNLSPKSINGHTCSLNIGPEELDWYLTISGNGLEFNEWMDYNGYNDDPTEKLIADKLKDISWFIEGWFSSDDVKLTQHKSFFNLVKRTSAQWKHGNDWSSVEVYDPNR